MAKGNHTPTIGAFEKFNKTAKKHGAYRVPCYKNLTPEEQEIYDNLVEAKPSMIRVFTDDIRLMMAMESSLMQLINRTEDVKEKATLLEALDRLRLRKNSTGRTLARFMIIDQDKEMNANNIAALAKAIEQSARRYDLEMGTHSSKSISENEGKEE